ncbi:MAG TPA: hypothetical protein VFS44_04860 [Gemmatimonadaceae bacterium]|nr:hypothetical protein [Gemmatimonadaceae bacterium]
MKTLVLIALAAVLGGCASRKVEVTTGATPSSGVSLNVTNNASQAVNVYVTSGGSDIFVGQVAPNSTQLLSVSGVAAGSTVTLKARLADGTRTYTRDNVALSGSTAWTVP